METKVSLQDPFSYAFLPLIIAGGIIILLILALVIIHFVKKAGKRPQEKKEPVKSVNINKARKKALTELDKLQKNLLADKISIRETYQRMSEILRVFVAEVTGIKVINFTLTEVRKMGNANLTELMTEYYPPEFEQLSRGDANASIDKTKKVVEQWI